MRVAFVSTYPPAACGIASYTRELAAGLKATDASLGIDVVTEKGGRRVADAHVWPSFDRDEDYVAPILARVEGIDPDLVHIQHEYGVFGLDDRFHELLAGLRSHHRRVVVTLHTVHTRLSVDLGCSWRDRRPPPADLDIERYQRQVGATADAVVVHQEEAIRQVLCRQGLADDRVVTIPHGTPSVVPPTKAAARTALGIPLDQSLLLGFGYFEPAKNHAVLIEGLSHLTERVPKARLLIGGYIRHPVPETTAYRAHCERVVAQFGLEAAVSFLDDPVPDDEVVTLSCCGRHRMFRLRRGHPLVERRSALGGWLRRPGHRFSDREVRRGEPDLRRASGQPSFTQPGRPPRRPDPVRSSLPRRCPQARSELCRGNLLAACRSPPPRALPRRGDARCNPQAHGSPSARASHCARRRLKLFISYRHVPFDRAVCERLAIHLASAADEIQTWVDRGIELGDAWREEIERAIETSDVGVVLVSADFLVSPFIRDVELPMLVAAHRESRLRLIPLYVAPSAVVPGDISGLQGPNVPSKPLSALTRMQREAVYADFVKLLHEQAASTGVRGGRDDRQARAADITLERAPAAGLLFDRTEIRREIAEFLTAPHQRICVVHGFHGVGKTTLAAKLVEEHGEPFADVFWVMCRSSERSGLMLLARLDAFLRRNGDDSLGAFMQHLAEPDVDLDAAISRAVEALTRVRYLLVLDEFQAYLDSANALADDVIRRLLLALSRAAGGTKVLLLSNRRPSLEQGFDLFPTGSTLEREVVGLPVDSVGELIADCGLDIHDAESPPADHHALLGKPGHDQGLLLIRGAATP